MARGAPIFAKLDVANFDSPDIMSLSREDRWTYEAGLWKLAVRERSSVLPKWKYGVMILGSTFNSSPRYLRLALKRIADKDLIGLIDDETVIVYGVKERHPKLLWRDFPIHAPNGENRNPRTVQDGSQLRSGILRVRDISTNPDTEIVTQRRDPPEPGAVDVKKLLAEAGEKLREKRRLESEAPRTGQPLPWKDPEPETELEREVHAWFLELWPHGLYDWGTEKNSLISQVREYRRGSYAYARAILLEHRREGKHFEHGELAYLNGIAREQAKKVSPRQ